jgi:hypothetical protein
MSKKYITVSSPNIQKVKNFDVRIKHSICEEDDKDAYELYDYITKNLRKVVPNFDVRDLSIAGNCVKTSIVVYQLIRLEFPKRIRFCIQTFSTKHNPYGVHAYCKFYHKNKKTYILDFSNSRYICDYYKVGSESVKISHSNFVWEESQFNKMTNTYYTGQLNKVKFIPNKIINKWIKAGCSCQYFKKYIKDY